VHSGSYFTFFRGTVRRYRCRLCGHGFSEQTFSIDYYAKRRLDYRLLMTMLSASAGIRQMARHWHLHPATVLNKIMRLSRNALAIHGSMVEQLLLDEDLVADGLESYWVSQYFPNNLTILAGSRSQLVYGFDGVTVRRSGRMSEGQKRRRGELERSFRADPHGVEHSFSSLVELCCRMVAHRAEQGIEEPVVLHTDLHLGYLAALRSHGGWLALRSRGLVCHEGTSSRLPRTRANPLFSANYLDRELRKDLAEHVRQTVRFARNVNHSMERLALYLFAHNLFKRYRINQPAADTRCHYDHAQRAIVEAMKRLPRMFGFREFLSRSPVAQPFLAIWLRMHSTPLKRRPEYLPRFLLA
jgi:hypothetical protein